MVKEVWEMLRRISFFYALIHGSLVKALSEALQKKITLSDSNKLSNTFDLENCPHHFPPKTPEDTGVGESCPYPQCVKPVSP